MHADKAEILCHTFKERLGTFADILPPQNPSELIQAATHLGALESPFTHEKIDLVVKDLPSAKSPGPDGFNNEFLKKCSLIIATDFYDLCEAFQRGDLCLQSLNGSYITLLPKIDHPSKAGDYRPISLLNFSMKLITKPLANILQQVVISLIHVNQYGFIKSRTIQDCLA